MGFLRITSGSLRGRKVRAPDGEQTRPLLTRVRKSLVDLLRPRLAGAAVLDLFGGSGAIAFELLSSGAARATLVELSPAAVDLIRSNALDLGVADRVQVLCGDALAVVPELHAAGACLDIVVVAPPYGLALQQRAADVLGANPVSAPDGLVVVQRDAKEPAVVAPVGWRFLRTRAYGRTVFDFYEAAQR